MDRKRILTLALAAVLCLSPLLPGCSQKRGPEKEPLKQLLDAVQNTCAMLEGQGPDISALFDSMDKGRISVDAMGFLESVIYIDQTDGGFANYVKFGPEGQQIQMSMIKRDRKIALMFPTILGDKAYGSDLDDLKNAPVWESMGMDPDSFGLGGSGVMGSIGKLGKLVKDLGEALKGVQIASEIGKTNISGEEVEAIVVTFQLQPEQLRKLMGLPETTELGVGLAVNIHPETEHIMSVDCRLRGSVDGEPGDIGLILTLGKETAASGKYTLDIQSLQDDRVVASRQVQLRVKDDDVSTTVDLTVTGDGEGIEIQQFRGTLTHDKQTQRFKLDLDEEGVTSQLEGMLRYKPELFQVYLATLRKDGQERVLDTTLSFETAAEGSLPELPEYTDMSELTQEQWQSLIMMMGYMLGQYRTD